MKKVNIKHSLIFVGFICSTIANIFGDLTNEQLYGIYGMIIVYTVMNGVNYIKNKK